MKACGHANLNWSWDSIFYFELSDSTSFKCIFFAKLGGDPGLHHGYCLFPSYATDPLPATLVRRLRYAREFLTITCDHHLTIEGVRSLQDAYAGSKGMFLITIGDAPPVVGNFFSPVKNRS